MPIRPEHQRESASRALRHADIAITSQHYLDKRKRTVAGLGRFLTSADNVTPFPTAKDVTSDTETAGDLNLNGKAS